jgi:hypothetical protein
LGQWVDRVLAGVALLDVAPPEDLVAALAGIPSAPGFDVSRAELISLVKDALAGLGRGSLGGPGAGVALLSLREARSWTFGHLFILGANRGAFPKGGTDDPLLPERERRLLRSSLPSLPRVGGDVALERYGVAQLLSSSPSVTLVWQTVDAGGKAGTASPLVSFLLADSGTAGSLPEARSALPAELPSPSPVGDYLMRAGLYGSRDEVRLLLPLALTPPSADSQQVQDAAALAQARLAVLDEIDPDPLTDAGLARWTALGPFLGQVGGMAEAEDPRRRNFSANSLEGLATCPWRSFLTGYLGLKEVQDPRADIPQVSPRLVGTLVHQVLEDLACERGLDPGGDLVDVLERDQGVRVPLPSGDRLVEACLLASRALLLREGLLLPGLAELLQRRAMAFLEQAFVDGPLPPSFGEGSTAGAPRIVGVEVEGLAEVGGHVIGFRADRIDRCGDELVFVDYKSGAALSDAVRQSTRDRAYFEAVSQGRKLQAAIYASAAGPLRSSGRYLFLRPDLSDGARRVDHDPSDSLLSDALESTVSLLATGLHEGQLFPRLVGLKDQKEPKACQNCSVSSACVRGDSSARGRLVRYAAGLSDGESTVFQDLWRLPRRGKDVK